MKKLLLLMALFGTLIIAGAHPAPSSAAINRAIALYGNAKEYNGAFCFHDCTVVASASYNGQPVWSTSGVPCQIYIVGCGPTWNYSCGTGHIFNWGNVYPPNTVGTCPEQQPQPGDGRWHVSLWTGSVIKSYVRHACVGGSGYYFSPTNSHTLNATENRNVWMGVQTLGSPGSGCQI